MKKITGALFLVLSLALFLAGGAAVLAMIRALTVESTLAAIESAFGTMIIAIFLLVMGRMTLKAGLARLGGRGIDEQN